MTPNDGGPAFPMIMSAHTPGPWRVCPHDQYDKEFAVAGIRADLCTIKNDDVDQKEAEANARLIAAAPDLLEALRKAERHCPPNSEAEILARAAIAKAEGKT